MAIQAKGKSLKTGMLVLIVVTILDSLLAGYAKVPGPNPGVVVVYLAVAFMIAFTLWFGLWGAIAAYVGCFIGAGVLSGIPVGVNLYWSLADLWQVLIPLVAFKALHAEVSLKTRRDMAVFLVFGVALNNLAGATWGSVALAVGGLIPWGGVVDTFTTWFAGNVIVTFVVTSLVLRFITPYFQKTAAEVSRYWR